MNPTFYVDLQPPNKCGFVCCGFSLK